MTQAWGGKGLVALAFSVGTTVGWMRDPVTVVGGHGGAAREIEELG